VDLSRYFQSVFGNPALVQEKKTETSPTSAITSTVDEKGFLAKLVITDNS
jgi:hypothetical protein